MNKLSQCWTYFIAEIWHPFLNSWVIRNFFIILSILLILAGVYIGYFLLDGLRRDYDVFGTKEIDIPKTGAVGDFVAGIVGTLFSLAGFIILIITYRDQKRSNEKNKVESRIFTLLQIHVDNSNNVNYRNPYNNG